MTKDAAQQGKRLSLSVAGWPLRRKIALALAIPLLLAATLGGLRVQNDLADSSNASRSAQQVAILEPAVAYLTAAETAMVAAQSQSAASQGDLIDAIDDIVGAADTLETTRGTADLDPLQTAHVNALLDLSQAMRSDDAENLGPATWIALVRQLESSVSQLITSVNAAQTTPEPRLEQLSQAMSGRQSLAMQQGLVANSELAQSGSQELFSEVGVEAAAIDRLAGSVEGADDLTAELRTSNTRHLAQIKDDLASTLDGRDAYSAYDEITNKLITGVTKTLTDAASSARRSALLGAFLTLLALAAAVVLALFIARSLLEPMNRVREGALAVARHRLPDAVARIRAGEEPEPIKTIDVTTNEEIGQLARAVDDLHRQAIHLASGEAQLRQTVNAMFVTLSRRSNSLVNQQLAQIERLEQDEENPKRLESLFRLDHLASRMRRTADSLLILADAPSRSAGQFSLTVGESLQAAISSVQDYQRVQIMSHLTTRISDDAAPDVVHLLTELVDNALSFSPPTEPVRLAARLGADGATITVTDAGLGVPPAELEQLNSDLAHNAEATPDTARRMGLFVVSRLAERHGVVASLARNPGGGMTATVVLPPSILPELPQTATPAAVAPGMRSTQQDALNEPYDDSSSHRNRGRSRSDKAAEKAAASEARAAEKAAATDAKAAERSARKEAAREAEFEPIDEHAAAPQQQAPQTAAPVETTERPSLQSLMPRRQPGANTPVTGPDAFLPPKTSTESGPLFSRRTPAAPVEPAAASEAPSGSETYQRPSASEAYQRPADDTDAGAPGSTEKVAPVVPITALASRQRAQAEEEARASEELARETRESEALKRQSDPLSDPLNDPISEPEQPRLGQRQPQQPPLGQRQPEQPPLGQRQPQQPPLGQRQPEQRQSEPVRSEDEQVPGVDPADPLGLGTASVSRDMDRRPNVESEQERPSDRDGAPSTGLGMSGGLPSRTRGSSDQINRDMPGLPSRGADAGRSGGDSPIFKSMRSGWLASDGEGEWHETEIDRGWEIAENVADERPAVESTPTGLPRRAPGQRLVPGSVTQPEVAKNRDPEAIRRRLQSHTAGVSRGRRAAQSSPQHTEAGPA